MSETALFPERTAKNCCQQTVAPRILEDYVKNRLRLSTSDLENLMGQPLKYSSDFKTYKPLFKRLKFLFFMLAKQELVPLSFYEKYCK